MKNLLITIIFILATCFIGVSWNQVSAWECLSFSGSVSASNWSGGSIHLSCGHGTIPEGHPYCPGADATLNPGDTSYNLDNCDCTVPHGHGVTMSSSLPAGCTAHQQGNTGGNGDDITNDIYINCPAPTATLTPVPPTPTPGIDWCNNCGTHPEVCVQYNCGNACNANGSCYFTGNPTPTPRPPTPTTAIGTPTPTEQPPTECMPGRVCSCSGEGATHCDECAGQWCNGDENGVGHPGCHCTQPPGPPPPPPGNTPTPLPTAIQQPTAEVTAPPTPTVNPVVPTPTGSAGHQLSQRWVCLDSKPCLDGGCSGQGQVDHRAKISSKVDDAKPLSSSPTYIFECLRVPDPARPDRTIQKCTTGIRATDLETVGDAILPDLQRTLSYKFNGMFHSGTNGLTPADNPVPKELNNNGDIGTYEWESYTTDNVNRLFFAMNWYDPNGPQAGNESSQKQAIVTYDTQSKKCIMIRWDPRGTVFDSKSLKPVEGAEVALLKKLENGKFVMITDEDVLGGGLQNPYITKADGAFAFYVPDGSYKLIVKKDNYSYPAEIESEKSFGGYKNIYYGQEFTQKGKIHEFDIPLDPDYKAIMTERIASLIKKAVDAFIN